MGAEEIVKEHWDKMAEEPPKQGTQWVHSQKILEEINRRVSGDPKVDWMEYTMARKFFVRHPPEKFSCLSLACGSGALERGLASTGMFGYIEGIDISEGSIRIAREEAAKANLSYVHYLAADLNHAALEQKKYDVILSASAMHHIKNLEHLLGQIQKALKPGGTLVLSDFVGPSQFQWTDKQIALMNAMLDRLSPRLRNDILNPGTPKPHLGRCSIEHMNKMDPSEAIRAKEIVPLIEERFNIVARKDWGGTLLHLGLQNIIGNFDENDPTDLSFLSFIIFFEETLIKEKVIESDFTFLVASPKRRWLPW